MEMKDNQLHTSAPLRTEKIEGKGRGFVASQPLKAGQIVLRESPILIFSAFPLKQRHRDYCDHCYRFLVPGGGKPLACPTCSDPEGATFCNSKCQSLAISSTHTPWVCQALSYLRNYPFHPEERQVQACYLVAAYNLAAVSPSAFQALLSLDGGGPHDGAEYLDVSVFLHSVISLFPFPFPTGLSLSPSAGMTAGLLAKERRNSFCLMEPYVENGGRSVRAYAIYPNASLFNHDCVPNACRFDYPDSVSDGNTDIIIRMMHDVPQGWEVCLSYFRLRLIYEERKKRLLDYFGFACLCELCKAEKNKIEHNEEDVLLPHGDFFERFVCQRENCGGTLAPLPPSDGTPSDVVECNFCGSLKKV